MIILIKKTVNNIKQSFGSNEYLSKPQTEENFFNLIKSFNK